MERLDPQGALERSREASPIAPKTPSTPAMPRKLDRSLLDALWTRMTAMFGHTWTSAYGAAPEGIAADTWATALAGLSPQQLAGGMRGVVKLGSAYPPSAPHFRLLCYDIPSLLAVRAELQARESTPPSPFARLVWQWLDGYRWRTANADTADRLLQQAYAHARELVMEGHPLPDPSTAEIEHQQEPERAPARPSDVVLQMAACRAAAGVTP